MVRARARRHLGDHRARQQRLPQLQPARHRHHAPGRHAGARHHLPQRPWRARVPDGFLHQGESEWRDLEAAIRTARSMGASHIVLYGGSMGGAIVEQLLTRSPLADLASAAVLENPEISSRRTGEFAAAQMHMPSFMLPIMEQVIDWRGGFDIAAIDLLGHPPRVKPPTLLLMGDADKEHPVETARELAKASNAMNWPIQYEEFPGAGHSEIWNTDRERYDRTLAAFLTRTLR
ncbi:S9 family peptidase [Microbispora sp. KK1-11]|uniref:alpha/beta hydrolase family protein n=1 Tax=Microbispora sp. KK1-11 TaxID=2053005 RepID=UPI00115B0DE7|nr:prolyl oligopeptidase family serine peptidase [Microbispora sp. KK1-11]TQS29270.1 prolyl oligopeptidase family serine peptidase [Microbispora sp. KK1-11]